jgi:trans-2,3-dihydro-3-hydroxyanthranilate isomerase
MQALARETNLSETTFIFPRTPEIERDRGIHVRIFLTTEEVPFAGHPTLGTASWLYWNHSILRGAPQITLDLGIGPVPVRFTSPQPDEQGIFGTMQQNDPTFGEPINSSEDRATLAAALNLSIDDLDPNLPAQVVSTGMSFCIVPLRSIEVAARLRIPQQSARTHLDRIGAKFFHCITPANANSGADWHARMQFDKGEDPATGSASGCTIAYLVRHGLASSGQPIVIEQGIEMLRPSRIHVSAAMDNNAVTKVFVGGRTIPVASGRFFLP